MLLKSINSKMFRTIAPLAFRLNNTRFSHINNLNQIKSFNNLNQITSLNNLKQFSTIPPKIDDLYFHRRRMHTKWYLESEDLFIYPDIITKIPKFIILTPTIAHITNATINFGCNIVYVTFSSLRTCVLGFIWLLPGMMVFSLGFCLIQIISR